MKEIKQTKDTMKLFWGFLIFDSSEKSLDISCALNLKVWEYVKLFLLYFNFNFTASMYY